MQLRKTKLIFKRRARLILFPLIFFFAYEGALAQAPEQCWRNYAVDIKTNTLFKFEESSPTRHSLKGFLALRPIQETIPHKLKGSKLWAMQLHQITQEGNGTLLPTESFLETPFVFELEKTGLIRDFFFPVKLSEEQQDRLKGLAFYFQSQKKIPSSPFLKEHDTLGTYEADYQFKEDKVWKSKKTYYVNNNKNNATLINKVDIIESKISLSKDLCLFSGIKGNEQIELSNSENSYSMSVKQRYQLELTSLNLTPLLWTLPDDFQTWKLSSTEPQKLSEEELSQLRKSLFSNLQSLDTLNLRPGELAKWLTQYELVIESLSSYFHTASLDDATKMRIFSALGLVDTKSSNRLLISLVHDLELNETDRFRALRALTSGTNALDHEQKDQLIELLAINDDFGSASLQGAAIMTIGAVVSRREQNDYSDEILSYLEDHLSPNIDLDRQAALIASLGNSMSPKVIDKVSNYSSSSNSRVRANVASSLGQIGGEESKKLLSRMLHNEDQARPQQAILQALSSYQLENQDISTAAKIGQSSPSERTRKQAIVLLSNQTHKPLQAKQHLKDIMKQESSRKNFALAAKSLVALQKQSITTQQAQ